MTDVFQVDMGMSYDELSVFGRCRKIKKLGPFSMFQDLSRVWRRERGLSAAEISTKVKRFHHFYSINRHKTTIVGRPLNPHLYLLVTSNVSADSGT